MYVKARNRLPRVEIARPAKVVGKSTVACMQSGLFHGYVGLVDLVKMQALVWDDDSLGARFSAKPIPPELADAATAAREKLVEAVADCVESTLQERPEREISTHDIGAFVMEELKKLDKVAYVRFASVYRHFRDIGEFMSELKDLLNVKEG